MPGSGRDCVYRRGDMVRYGAKKKCAQLKQNDIHAVLV